MSNHYENIIAYKSAGEYIIKLFIPSDSKTNINRKGIDKKYAKHRSNMAIVDDIYHKFTREKIKKINSDYDETFVYEINKKVKVTNYNNDSNAICTSGIHFYLTEEVAFMHNLDRKNYIGEYKTWYDNGKPSALMTTNANGNIELIKWWENGEICEMGININGNKKFMKWYESGKLYKIKTVTKGKIKYKSWYENGQLRQIETRTNDRIEFMEWYENGKPRLKDTRINNKIKCESWHKNGGRREKIIFN